MYYLQTRYYDPEVSRFITIDDISYLAPDTINGLNLYAYCGNNPVMNIDPTGTFVLISFLIGLGIAAAIGAGIGAVSYVASEAISYAITGEWTWSWGMFAGAIIGGAIGGALLFAFPGLEITGSSFITGFLSTSIGMGLENAFGEADHSFLSILGNSLLSGVLSAGFAKITSLIKIPGFTGRGSISQVYRQINTKFFNGTIKRITGSTLMKMIAYEATYSLFNTIASGIIDAIEYIKYVKKNIIPAEPIFFPNNFPYVPLYP